MRNILTKLTMGLLCASLAAAPAEAAIERAAKPKATTETTTAPSHAVATASSSFKTARLTRAEKREARKAIMKALRAGPATTLLLVILCLLPPLNLLAVFLKEGLLNKKFWIALILTLLFIVPGVIYSLLVVLNVL